MQQQIVHDILVRECCALHCEQQIEQVRYLGHAADRTQPSSGCECHIPRVASARRPDATQRELRQPRPLGGAVAERLNVGINLGQVRRRAGCTNRLQDVSVLAQRTNLTHVLRSGRNRIIGTLHAPFVIVSCDGHEVSRREGAGRTCEQRTRTAQAV